MNRFGVAFVFGILAILSMPTPATAPPGAQPKGMHGFDFEFGEWQVHHRIKRPTGEWFEFDGTCTDHGLMAGAANVEEHIFHRPRGITYGVALRSYDAGKDEWSIWWLDSRFPNGPVDPPSRGQFENGVGTFYSDYMDKGKPMRGRLVWSKITATSARWEQSASADGGKTWEPNWIMTFQRRH